ncbi:fluoride efflux transporter CrcB [Sandarakinorhabdus sp.]|uniref:fluoride efflux transporter CrcB n=1 Tax=Sandarakinorhabdus sp. TaxID=1916663 RepID=UPI00286E4C23|nr:fluoride efflux transporter CrcB [Sandarakinorhabdus sp.]
MPSLSAISPLVLVAVGGGVGSALRYLVGGWAQANLGPGFPFGTWAVNIIGGLAMGLLAGLLARGTGDEGLRLLVGVGLLGGFTTFSAFSLEIHTMILRGDVGLGAAYAVSSVAGSVFAVLAGVYLARLV